MATLPASLDATLAVARRRRRMREAALSVGLWAVIIAGWINPLVGLIVPLCFVGALAVAAFRSRGWCDWWCPRGVFLDAALARVSPREKVPQSLQQPAVRMGVLALMMGGLVIGLALTWGNAAAIGRVFIALLTATTVAGTIMGLVSHHRSWCAVCPPGTMAGWIAGGDHSPLGPDHEPLRVDEPPATAENAKAGPCGGDAGETEGGCGGVAGKNDRRPVLADLPRVR